MAALFLHDATIVDIFCGTAAAAAPCEGLHLLKCNPIVEAKKSQPQPHRVNGPLCGITREYLIFSPFARFWELITDHIPSRE